MSSPSVDPWITWIGRCAQLVTLMLASAPLIATVIQIAAGESSKWTVLVVFAAGSWIERLWRGKCAIELLAALWSQERSSLQSKGEEPLRIADVAPHPGPQ